MQVQPSLAISYEVMSPTRVRFKLRPGVKFHDGTPMNAAAVKFTLSTARSRAIRPRAGRASPAR